MNYNFKKTIQKYGIGKNILFPALLVGASFLQGCPGGVAAPRPTVTHYNSVASLREGIKEKVLGTWKGEDFQTRTGEFAKTKKERVKSVKLNSGGTVETCELPKDAVVYKKDQYTGANGLLVSMIEKFSQKDNHRDAKLYALVSVSAFVKQVETAATPSAVKNAFEELKTKMAKLTADANGVMVIIDVNHEVSFRDLTAKQATEGTIRSSAYVLGRKLYKFVEDEVLKPIADEIAKLG
jgi:hypothetical protein